jgi:UDP-N-acetyl-D-glucosamine dehydrogenase
VRLTFIPAKIHAETYKLKTTKFMEIAIIGLGYVGLPLSLQFARSGVNVLGLDIDPAKIAAIREGRSYIRHIGSDEIKTQVDAGRFSATSDFSRIVNREAVILCVPTPLSKNREPDISFIIETARQFSPFLSRGSLVVLESTTYPGTTEDVLRTVIEKESGLKAGIDFHLAFSPEREDPGNPASNVRSIPKVVGGLTSACRQRAEALYKHAVSKLVPVSSCRTAEATKLLENIFRSVNIALVNELKVVYSAMGIDIWEVIEAAKTKPFGYMAFYPGPGLGGHCIPIDPFYLTWKAREYGQTTRFIELAGEINTNMPAYVVHRVSEALNSKRKAINGSRILIIGIAYKPNVDDDRESPSYHLMDLLASQGAAIDYYDPFIPEIRESREHAHWAGTRSVPWRQKIVSSYDLIVVSTAHDAINFKELSEWGLCIVDTRNALADVRTRPGTVWKA